MNLFRMSRAAEFRDPETGAHIQRMAHYSQIVAQGYGLDAAAQRLILEASPMHDVGKIGIPAEVLHRKGRLTMDEPKKRLLNSLRMEPGVFSEVYISSPVGEGVARNILDPATHLLFSNKLEDNAPIDELRAQAAGGPVYLFARASDPMLRTLRGRASVEVVAEIKKRLPRRRDGIGHESVHIGADRGGRSVERELQ